LTIARALAKIGASKMESKQILAKIQLREMNYQKSGRGFFMAAIINKLRRRLIVEINHILEPILENQKEINLRLLKEVEKIKKIHEQLPKTDSQASQEKH
jgi:hypothetical protein